MTIILFFSSSEKRRLTEYIIVQTERIQSHNFIDVIDNPYILDLLESEEYHLAMHIYDSLLIDFKDHRINETLSLAVLLSVYRDFSSVNLNKQSQDKEACDELTIEICNYLKSTWSIDLSSGISV